MSVKLSEGALEVMLRGGEFKEPILQVLGCKKVASSANNTVDRFRLLVSDGRHLNSFAMLSTQLAPLAASGDLPDFTVVRIKRYTTSTINANTDKEKQLLVILELDILKKGNEVGVRIGNPMNFDGTGSANTSNAAPPTPASATSPDVKPFAAQAMPRYGSQVKMSPGPNSTIHPIASLNPYQNKWCIKARVTNKQPIRTYTNARGEGKLFSVTFTDESGEIRATGFNSAVDKFSDLLELNKTFLVSGCHVKAANKKFNSGDYEMTFHDDSQIIPCADDTNLPTVVYKFTPITKITELDLDSMIDVIGVAKTASDVQNLVSRNTGKELKKREVTLVDSSNAAVTLTLWGQQAEDFDISREPVVAVKGARLSEFQGGRSVSLVMSSRLEIDPDIEEAHKLRGWYDNGGNVTELMSISAKSGGAGGSSGSNWVHLGEIASQGLGRGDKADYFSDVVNVLMVRSENCVYKACPTTECKKKILDMNNGQYRCEKCGKDFPNYTFRMLLSAQVSDFTGSHWVTLFNDEAQKLLGATADEIGKAMENKDESYKQFFTDVNFKKYQMRFRAKTESYNDETRLKISVASVDPVDSKAYAKRLLEQFKQRAGVSTGN